MKNSGELQIVSAISYRVGSTPKVQIKERLGIEALAAVTINCESYGIEEYGSLVTTLERGEYRSKPKKLELDMKHCESPPMRPFIKDAPKLDIKVLPSHLRYVFLGKDDIFQIIIALNMNMDKV